VIIYSFDFCGGFLDIMAVGSDDLRLPHLKFPDGLTLCASLHLGKMANSSYTYILCCLISQKATKSKCSEVIRREGIYDGATPRR
jgi:hypothetical protein